MTAVWRMISRTETFAMGYGISLHVAAQILRFTGACVLVGIVSWQQSCSWVCARLRSPRG